MTPITSDCEKHMRDLIDILANDYGIADLDHKIVFSRNSHGGSAGGRYAHSWEMFFGLSGCINVYNYGWIEYKRLEPLLAKHNLVGIRGWQGIDVFVLHEFAHVLTYVYNRLTHERRGYKWYRSITAHGAEYKEIYAELLNLYMPIRLTLTEKGLD